MKFSKPLIAVSITLALAGCSLTPSQSNESFSLTVAHINDTHSNFDPVKSSFKANETVVYNEFGGFPRLHTMAEEYKKAAEDQDNSFLFLHGGDAWQGSAYFKLNEGAMNAELLSRMGIDAMALGNHEFDLNNAKLNQFISDINFPVLAANIDTSEDADLKDQTNLKPYTLFAFDGNKKTVIEDINNLPAGKDIVAVFGIALDDMPNLSPNTGDVQFFDMVESAQTTVDMFKAKGINNIIALTHIGNAVDVDIASKVNGIDLIVGGHSHTLLGDFTNIGHDHSGTYAQMVTNPNGNSQTCVVQAGEYSQAIGQLEVSFDGNGNVTSCAGLNTLLTNDEYFHSPLREAESKFSVEENAAVVNFIEGEENIIITDEETTMRQLIDTKYKPAVDEAYGKVIAQVPVEVIHERRPGDRGTDKHGSDVAAIIAAGQYYWANSPEVVEVTGMKVDFSLIGAGGIRTNIEAGEYREGNVSLEMLPFSNFMSVVPVKGKVIKELIDGTVSATLPEGSHAGKFPYGGYIRFQYTETTPNQAGKLDYVEVMTGTAENPIWTPLQDNKTYNVAVNNYNATGNDGWTPLFTAQQKSTGRVDLAYVDGQLTAFNVKNIEEQNGRFLVNYEGQAPNCKADNTRCNTDAQAVIDYIAQEMPVIKPLSYEVVTFERAM
ncbi:5'-nucleotidase C-terminal domain-containing protein [Photobacterium makurazakiensis]|uniref:bifunctional metallophosphatase/5'-nucleotidase n=1 Tax=Photobacterium makurazakiensis TaxID=2910234 RepID=UPI003D14FF3D